MGTFGKFLLTIIAVIVIGTVGLALIGVSMINKGEDRLASQGYTEIVISDNESTKACIDMQVPQEYIATKNGSRGPVSICVDIFGETSDAK